jgi:hypothetical protein
MKLVVLGWFLGRREDYTEEKFKQDLIDIAAEYSSQPLEEADIHQMFIEEKQKMKMYLARRNKNEGEKRFYKQ